MDESRFDRYRPRRRLESEKPEEQPGSYTDWKKDWVQHFYSGGGQQTKKINQPGTIKFSSAWLSTSTTTANDVVWSNTYGGVKLDEWLAEDEWLVSLGSDE